MDEVFEKLQSALECMIELRGFMLYRLAVYCAMGAIVTVYWIAVFVIYWLLSKLMDAAATLFLLVAIAGNYGLFRVAKDYLLYTVQAGYVAVLTQSLSAGIPPHVNQRDLAKQMVGERFRDIAMLATADTLIKGIVASYSRTVEDMAAWVPIPGMQTAAAAVNAVVGRAVNTIDEAVLSLVFLRKDQTTWQTVREGVVLYAGAWKPVLKLSAGLVVLDFLCTPLVFVMLLMVVGMPAAVVFSSWTILRGLAIIVPFVLTYLVRQVIFEPLAVTAVVIAYQRAVKGAKMDPAMEEKLAQVAPQFSQLVAKAEGNEPEPAPAAAPGKPAAKPAPAPRPRQRPKP